ncbi:MAG: two-component sensor histidine kinase [Gammaproteobacteria bacterium]|nr:two-component sensor histidine kinase [Gammaproteobacteria bacterium]
MGPLPAHWLKSLRAHVLLGVSAVLVVLFGITIIALDVTFQRSTERALEELLDAQLLGLIALAEPDPVLGLTLPDDPADSRFNVADSGLYGALWDGTGERIWQSLSLLDRGVDPGALPEPGERRFTDIAMPGLAPARGLLMGIAWEYADGKVDTFTFGAMVSLEPYTARQQSFRRNLIGWFAGITLAMLVVIAGLLRLVLRPVGRLEAQVREVEAGRRSQLSGRVPTELKGLAGNLNALIDTERRRQVRYRNTLDDLAHSLKTPLAVMRTLLGDSGRSEMPEDAELIQAVDRMEERVTYQLRRARASGTTGLGTEPIKVAPLLEDLKLTLDKVYRDEGISAEIEASNSVVFLGDGGDFTEIAGNIIENAYKYGSSRVHVRAWNEDGSLRLTVEDDGPGIGADKVEALMERGSRADESKPGQGIGLAVAREIAALYQGQLDVAESGLGGAKLNLTLRRASLNNEQK